MAELRFELSLAPKLTTLVHHTTFHLGTQMFLDYSEMFSEMLLRWMFLFGSFISKTQHSSIQQILSTYCGLGTMFYIAMVCLFVCVTHHMQLLSGPDLNVEHCLPTRMLWLNIAREHHFNKIYKEKNKKILEAERSDLLVSVKGKAQAHMTFELWF